MKIEVSAHIPLFLSTEKNDKPIEYIYSWIIYKEVAAFFISDEEYARPVEGMYLHLPFPYILYIENEAVTLVKDDTPTYEWSVSDHAYIDSYKMFEEYRDYIQPDGELFIGDTIIYARSGYKFILW